MAAYIPISGLNELTSNDLTLNDFFPLVDSASMTTFRLPLEELNTWNAASGSVLSASYATRSLSSSHASNADHADSASYTDYALSASHALRADRGDSGSYSDYALSASHALRANNADTSSYAFRAFTSSYAIWASNADSASHSARAISSSYASASSHTITASYSVATGRTMPVGAICAYAGTVAPSGWLKCDGSIIPNTPENAALIALVGTSYGGIPSCNVYITMQTANAYQDLNNGTVTFTFSGGSGLYALYWAPTATTYYHNTAAPSRTFTGRDGYPDPQGYGYTVYDVGVTPNVSVAGTANVGYNRAATSTTFTIGSTQYRTPNMTGYFSTVGTVSPLIWIIKQ